MKRAGFTQIAVTLGLASLLDKGLLELREGYNEETDNSYILYSVTDEGFRWLQANQEKLNLTVPTKEPDDEDVPF